MALSLDSIYKPVNDFFLNHFKTDDASPVFFRFDKFGSVIDDTNFIVPDSPEDTGLAEESFSDLVNRLPLEDSDGVNIIFTESLIDDMYYHRLLNASIPFVATDDPNKDAIINSVSKMVSDAKGEYEKLSLARRSIPDYFRASFSTPGKWYDKNNKDIWTNHSFQASETVTTPVDNNSKFQLWRLKVNDAILHRILPVETSAFNNPAELHKQVLMMKANFIDPVTPISRKVAIGNNLFNATTRVSNQRTTLLQNQVVNSNTANRLKDVIVADHSADTSAPTFTIQANLQKTISGLALKQRLFISDYIKGNAPTQSVNTNSITVSFDYCLVSIRRPWFLDTFIKNNTWFVPGTIKGQLSASDTDGSLSVLPIGFVAIKNLSIAANWTTQDIATSKNATDFGPFEVTYDSVSNKLCHDGIQIIGWVLQKMPDLPPNNPPQ